MSTSIVTMCKYKMEKCVKIIKKVNKDKERRMIKNISYGIDKVIGCNNNYGDVYNTDPRLD